MDIQELKCTIAVVEGTQQNIDKWNRLKNREIAMMPTDSHYYKDFQLWIKDKYRFDGGTENPPMYISGSKTNEVIDLLVKQHEDFVQPHKDKLNKILK